MEYDNARNIDARSYRTTYRYDDRNNLIEESSPETGQLTIYDYDANNNRISETRTGETTRYTYDDSGKLTGRQRPLGDAWTWAFDYDPAGRLESVTDPLSHTTVFGYDDADNRTRITDANHHLTQFHYDKRPLSNKTNQNGTNWQPRPSTPHDQAVRSHPIPLAAHQPRSRNIGENDATHLDDYRCSRCGPQFQVVSSTA